MRKWIRIRYRDFYDVPRIFMLQHRNRQYLFDCKFDDDLDDYPEVYRVFQLSELSKQEVKDSWDRLSEKAVKLLGEIPVEAVKFDRTKRRKIQADSLDQLINSAGD